MRTTTIALSTCWLASSLALAACGSSDGSDGTSTGSAGESTEAGSSGASTQAGASSAGAAQSGGSAGAAQGGGGSGGAAGGSGMGGSSGATSNAGSAGFSSRGSSGGSTVDPNGGAPSGPSASRHTPRYSGTVTGTAQGYWEYLPPHYGNGGRYPLLVFWHGIGENGNGSMQELGKVPAAGPPMLIKQSKWPEDRKFVVLSPQHNGNNNCPNAAEITAFIAFAMGKYDVDPKRVYLTGLSCGAIGSWSYLGAHTNEVVAAAVLISGDGRGPFNQAGCALGKVPLWAFHGDMDPTVLPVGSTEPLGKLAMCQPAPVDAKLTIYPGVAHSGWNQTYDLSAGHDIYTWMLSHTKP